MSTEWWKGMRRSALPWMSIVGQPISPRETTPSVRHQSEMATAPMPVVSACGST